MKILCIEDDRFIGEMYARSLVAAGYEVELVTDGDDGLKAAKTGKYDLLLLDLMLPNKKGDDILATLRHDNVDLIPNTKIIVLTNFQQDTESRVAMEKRVDAYLIKADITPRRLVQIVEKL